MKKKDIIKRIVNNEVPYQQGVSVDCVVFGFHDKTLKVLLSKFNCFNKWMLPVGLIMKDEDMDAAAERILKKYTGLSDIYLRQFNVFGSKMRPNIKEHTDFMRKMGVSNEGHWISQRLIGIAYYALVEYSRVYVRPGAGEDIRWFNINEIPSLYSDHNNIIEKALSHIRIQLRDAPVIYRLLPEKFSFSELRCIYEAILEEELDRRNFQRKMTSAGYVFQLKESWKKPGIKPTSLFSFNKEKCDEILDSLFL
jgi:hypothetical protein